MQINNEQVEQRLWKISNAQIYLERAEAWVNCTTTDESTNIIDDNSFRILSELSATRSRCDSLQQSKKEKNESFSHESLKEKMNWIYVFRVRFNFDSNRFRRQKTFQITRLIEKNRKLSNDSDSHRKDRFYEFSSSS
jgi:hypothetical protein